MALAPVASQLELGEWDRALRPDLRLVTEADRQLARHLSESPRRLVIEELREGLRVRTGRWVGVVRFQTFEIRVTPKYAGGDLGVLQMLAHTRGYDALRRAKSVRDLAVEGTHLFDLIGLLLAEAGEQLARDGLLQDYVLREETLSVVRGRLLPFEQVTKHPGRVDQLECRYDDFETDVEENRLVSAALEAAGRHVRNADVRGRVNRVRTIFQGACDAKALDPAWIRGPVDYHRRNEHYQHAHQLARLILRQLAVRDVYAPGDTSSFAFLFNMDQLFEEFVTWLLRDRLRGTGASVGAQERNRLVFEDALTGRPYTSVRPDMIVRWRDAAGSPHRLPVDTKYKLYGDKRIDQGDLYQLFLYAYAYRDAAAVEPSLAYILFPSHGESRQDVRVRGTAGQAGARIKAIGIDLVKILDALEKQEAWTSQALDELGSMVVGTVERPAVAYA